MICLRCGHYTHPDRELDRVQKSEHCTCKCHPWNNRAATVRSQRGPLLAGSGDGGRTLTKENE